MYNDSLFRVSFKCVILNDEGNILAVREKNRSSWDIPGGGIEFGETIEESITRELREEIAYSGGIHYDILKIHDPVKLLTREVWQIKIVILLHPDNESFSVGSDAEALMFLDPSHFIDSNEESERRLSEYKLMAERYSSVSRIDTK